MAELVPVTLLGAPLERVAESAFFSWFHLEGVDPLPSPESPLASFRPSGSFHDRALVQLRLSLERTISGITLSLPRSFVDSRAEGPFARDIAKSFIEEALTVAYRLPLAAFHDAVSDLTAGGAVVIAHADAPKASPLPVGADPCYDVFMGSRDEAAVALEHARFSIANTDLSGVRTLVMALEARVPGHTIRETPDDDVSPENLAELIKREARAASDLTLVISLVIGVVGSAAMFALHPWAWRLMASASVTLAALGGWAMLDREFGERRENGRSAGVLRLLTAGVGAVAWVALVVFAFTLVSLALGEWKS